MEFERFLGDGLDMFCIVVEVSYVAMSDVRVRGLGIYVEMCLMDSWDFPDDTCYLHSRILF